MENDAADQLHPEGLKADGTLVRLADHGEGLDEEVVQGLALFEPLPELLGLCRQFLIGEGLHLWTQRLDLVDEGHDALQFPL